MGRRYRVGELARLIGVSVRTLHHYDQIGLLGPSGHSEGGHRLYEETDVLALQQILTLRYLGLPLKEIARLLRRPDFDLIASLRIQRRAPRDRISELERIEAGVQRLVDSRLSTGAWDWDVVATAASTVQGGLTHRGAEMDAHYTPEQMAQFKELGEQVGPEAIRQIEEEWTGLIAEVRANRHLAPTDPAAPALADRWNAANERVAAAYRDYPELWQAIGENYQKGSFAASEHTPQPEDFAFIAKVNEERGTRSEERGTRNEERETTA